MEQTFLPLCRCFDDKIITKHNVEQSYRWWYKFMHFSCILLFLGISNLISNFSFLIYIYKSMVPQIEITTLQAIYSVYQNKSFFHGFHFWCSCNNSNSSVLGFSLCSLVFKLFIIIVTLAIRVWSCLKSSVSFAAHSL